MPITTLLAYVIIVGMFASFVLGLGGVTLWMAIAERADRKAGAGKTPANKIIQAVEPKYDRAA